MANPTGRARPMKMRDDDWQYGMRPDEMQDIRDAVKALWFLIPSIIAGAIGVTLLVDALLATVAVAQWVWAISSVLTAAGVGGGIGATPYIVRVLKILTRIRKRYDDSVLPEATRRMLGEALPLPEQEDQGPT